MSSPRFEGWGHPPIPRWVEEFRSSQIEAVETVMEAYRSGYRMIFAEMPTGSGKSLTAEMVRRLLGERALYLVSTKQLQKQIEDRFNYAAILWGRRNYPVADRLQDFPRINAGLCDKTKDHACERCADDFDEDEQRAGCSFCHPVWDCPYEIAKQEALKADLAVTNYRYALTEMNYVGRFGEQRHKGQVVGRTALAIGDEADVIEDELMGFVEVNISPRRRAQFDLPKPTRKTVESAFVEWVFRAQKRLGAVDVNELTQEDQKWVTRMNTNLTRLRQGLKTGSWVYDDGGDSIIFRPVKVDRIATDYFWKHAEKWLLMSATICSPDIMARDLGLESHQWTSLSLGSSFDPKRRPIYVIPRADMRQKAGEGEWAKMAEAIGELLENYREDRVFIPTVSYRLNDYLMRNIPQTRRLVTYTSAATRQDALLRFRKQPGAVLLAPAMDRGLDLVDDDCRCVVLCKVMYPYLGDKQVSARMHSPGGRDWYVNQAIKRIVQATGRAIRHENDWADVWILDKAFIDLYRRYSRWFPRWWREAMDWTRGGREGLRYRGTAREAAGIR